MCNNFLEKLDDYFSVRVFCFKDIFVIGLGFVAVIFSLNIVIVRFIYKRIFEFDCPWYWPISVFSFRIPSWRDTLIAIAVLLLFYIISKNLSKLKSRISYVIFAGLVLVLVTNLIQGWGNAFITPIAGGGEGSKQYYHDAIKIENSFYFLRDFEQIQEGLLTHARTHPPGAVLGVFLLLKGLRSPALISIVIAVLSVILSMFFLYRLLSTEIDKDNLSIYATWLFALIPSIQIYYAASLDALIACFLLGVLYFFLHPKPFISILGSVFFLFLASFLTFGFLFILPVMVGFEILRKKSVLRSGIVLLGLGLIYMFIFLLSGYNYINSFKIASALENPHGFSLFSGPISYMFTRIEGLFEIILFFGPFLCVLAMRGMKIMKGTKSNLLTMTQLAVFTLLAMFISGAFRTGETARTCLFIYPYLMFPVALYLEKIEISQKEEILLSSLVFSQAVLMQMFGNYFW